MSKNPRENRRWVQRQVRYIQSVSLRATDFRTGFKRNLQIWVGLAILALAAGAAYAQPATDPTGKTVEFKQEMEGEIGGKVLKPGVYNVKITYENAQSGKLTVAKNKQILVELPCKIEPSDLNLESNSVAYDRDAKGQRVVRWLFVRGRREKVSLFPDQP